MFSLVTPCKHQVLITQKFSVWLRPASIRYSSLLIIQFDYALLPLSAHCKIRHNSTSRLRPASIRCSSTINVQCGYALQASRTHHKITSCKHHVLITKSHPASITYSSQNHILQASRTHQKIRHHSSVWLRPRASGTHHSEEFSLVTSLKHHVFITHNSSAWLRPASITYSLLINLQRCYVLQALRTYLS